MRCFSFILNGWGAVVNPGWGIVVGLGSPSGMVIENSWKKLAKKMNKTFFASDSPRQYRFPLPKLTNHSSFTNLPLQSRNLSGLKTSGSPQWPGSDRTLQIFMMTVVSWIMETTICKWSFDGTRRVLDKLIYTEQCEYGVVTLTENLPWEFHIRLASCPSEPCDLGSVEQLG